MPLNSPPSISPHTNSPGIGAPAVSSTRLSVYARGFGTMYTAAYRPDLGFVDYVWPGSRWRRTFDSPDDTHLAVYRDGWAASP